MKKFTLLLTIGALLAFGVVQATTGGEEEDMTGGDMTGGVMTGGAMTGGAMGMMTGGAMTGGAMGMMTGGAMMEEMDEETDDSN